MTLIPVTKSEKQWKNQVKNLEDYSLIFFLQIISNFRYCHYMHKQNRYINTLNVVTGHPFVFTENVYENCHLKLLQDSLCRLFLKRSRST